MSKERAKRALEPYFSRICQILSIGHEKFLFHAKPLFKSVYRENWAKGLELSLFLRHELPLHFLDLAEKGEVRIQTIQKAIIITIRDKYNLRLKSIPEPEDEDSFKLRSQSLQFKEYCNQKSLPGIEIDTQENLIIGYEPDYKNHTISKPSIYKPNGLDEIEWQFGIELPTRIAVPTLASATATQRKSRFKLRRINNEESAGES